MKIEENFSLKNYNSFQMDVYCDYFVGVENQDQLNAVLNDIRFKDIDILYLGGGSNLLFLEDFKGLIIYLENKGIEIIEQDELSLILEVQAGENWADLIKYLARQGYWGLECLAGIPGHVGACPVQNIGAYGRQVEDVILSVESFNTQTREKAILENAACEFAYRDSIFKRSYKGTHIIWSIRFKLNKQAGKVENKNPFYKDLLSQGFQSPSPRDVIAKVLELRDQKLPSLKIGSAGSYFKNPIISEQKYLELRAMDTNMPGFVQEDGNYKLSAAYLIDRCQWKGFKDAHAGVYEKHALILINLGGAKGFDIANLAQRIYYSVKQKYGVDLHPEVNYIGNYAQALAQNYKQVLDAMFNALPMFQRIGAAAYKPDLSNTIALMEALDNPHLGFKSIHIAGTNGKGSCSHILASVFAKAGYKTGLYTSPHLKDFRERIKINGLTIPQEDVIAFYQKHEKLMKGSGFSFFEMTVGMAFDYFAKQKVDIAIIETGMGGRLDSTNIIEPLLSLITNISMDHTQFLGDSLEKIAGEKAGIIKSGIPIIIGESQSPCEAVFMNKAQEKASPIFFADQIFRLSKLKTEQSLICDIEKEGKPYIANLELDLLGDSYQAKNIISTICVLDYLKEEFKLDSKAILEGYKEVAKSTSLMGRWQVLSQKPMIVCDTAHNCAGISLVMEKLKSYKKDRLHIVLGLVADKDINSVLALLPKEAIYYFCKADIPRSLHEEQLRLFALDKGFQGESYPSVAQALQAAKSVAGANDFIFVGGSNFVVAEVC